MIYPSNLSSVFVVHSHPVRVATVLKSLNFETTHAAVVKSNSNFQERL